MTIYNLIEILESYSSIKILRRFSENLIFQGLIFEIPENLLAYPVAMIKVRDSTLIIYI